jgi:alpha-L-rhamnosidase
MDNAGRQLLKKAIIQTVYFSENDVLGALGPLRVRELVGQSLQFIAQVVWPYYFNTGDIETLKIAYPYVYAYLDLFPMQENGLPEYRKGKSPDSWDWLDWGVKETLDAAPIQPAYYYQALVEAKKMAETLGEEGHLEFYTSRINSIKANYDKEFWKDGFYSSNGIFKDDRANALAITSGLAKPENYEAIVKQCFSPKQIQQPAF